MSKNQFTGTATQTQCNRKFCQFNKDQYCIYSTIRVKLIIYRIYQPILPSVFMLLKIIYRTRIKALVNGEIFISHKRWSDNGSNEHQAMVHEEDIDLFQERQRLCWVKSVVQFGFNIAFSHIIDVVRGLGTSCEIVTLWRCGIYV